MSPIDTIIDTGAAKIASVVSNGPKYLQNAIDTIKSVGLTAPTPDSSIVAPLLASLSVIDDAKATAIGRTLAYQEVFAALATKEISEMTYGKRFEQITESFTSIRDDMKGMVGQAEKGSLSIGDRVGNVVMKVTRGDIAYRFDKIQKDFKSVMKDALVQTQKERKVLEAYVDYRGALKEAEIMTLDIMKIAQVQLDAAKAETDAANAAVVAAANGDAGERAKLELARDEKSRAQKAADDRFQTAKSFSENLSNSYNIADMTFKRLEQLTDVKEKVANEGNTFFATNSIVFTALKVTMTGFVGLHEATQTLKSMKAGTASAIELVAEVGGKMLEEGTTAAYTTTDNATVVATKKLIDSVVGFQTAQVKLIADARKLSAENAEQIRKDAEAGRQAIIAAANAPTAIAA